MNVFYEFYNIAQKLNENNVEYALIGGVAVAFHAVPRFTKDVDILTHEDQLPLVHKAMQACGYSQSNEPWSFPNTGMTLHRFVRIEDNHEMIVDVLLAGDERQEAVMDNAEEAFCEGFGVVRVARKDDLIWLKQARGSLQDQADIEQLRHEQP